MNKKVSKLFLIFTLCFASFSSLPVRAKTYNAIDVWSEAKLQEYAENNILYFDDQFEQENAGGDECISSGGIEITIDPTDKQGYIMSKLKEAGYNVTSIAAIMGNLKAENTNFDPTRLEKPLNGKYTVPEDFIAFDVTKNDSSGKNYTGGLGIAQWTYWSRVKGLQEHADSLGQPVATIAPQTSFLIQELQGYSLPPAILNTLSMYDATVKVLLDYEGPEDKSDSVKNKRYSYAQGFYTLLIGENPDQPVDPDPELIICPDGGGGGGNGSDWGDDTIKKYLYLQGDPEWGNLNYGLEGIYGDDENTIKESGCGPSSFATMISIIRDQRITPAETADIAGRGGQHCHNCGSYHTITSYLGNHYGIHTQAINISITSIQAALDSGQMVHIVGKGSLPFTTGGHYVAIIKSVDGKWWVANSGSAAHQWESYDPITIVSNADYAVAVWE